MQTYWTTEQYDYEWDSVEEADKFLNEKYAEDVCENESPRNNEVFRSVREIIRISADSDDIVERKIINLEYVHEQSDRCEHAYW